MEAVLGPSVTQFVDRYVRTLLAWDIIVFFDRNPRTLIDNEGLATRLGRHPDQTLAEVSHLCEAGVLECSGGVIRFQPSDEHAEAIGGFVAACEDRSKRLALIAMVLHRLGPTTV